MCGIIGYLGEREATPVLMDGLKRLEYRGYDSAGVAVLETGSQMTSVTKSEAKVDLLIAKLRDNMPTGRLGIGHTRWATHGKPTVINAHPHTDCYGRISVVHNGIIENFAELKQELEAAGHEFVSDTDTEVVPHLIEQYYKGDFLTAVRLALRRIRGAYALAMFSLDDPELLVGARLNAPLVVGLGDGESFVASDITAIIPYTKKVLILGEGEMAAVTPLGATVTTLDGLPVEAKVIHVDWDVSQAEKGGFQHFMLKEIQETPEAVANALRGRLDGDGKVSFIEFNASEQHLRQFREVRLLGMGTSLHAAMVGEHVIEDWAGLPARAQDASEFRYRRPTLGEHTLTVVITQSGETADTLVGLRQARDRGSLTVAVTNVVGSTAARDSDGAIYLHSGPEIGVASTKTFVAHLISQYLLALRLATAHGRVSLERRQEIARSLRGIPEGIRKVLGTDKEIARLAHRYARFRNFMYVGRGIAYPVALEGALKLKEISYLHAEGSSGGELKHGPIALLDKDFPVVAICTDSATKDKMISNVHEVVARDAPVLAVISEGDDSLSGLAADVIQIPAADEAASAVLATVALQLFAYHVAVELGQDVDQPRNLAKSVTVE
ncbi:MAG: glutamine--fructose-6-phosphate transaminase (isomerizing) [Candidatus Nephthysia bennettiae]|uniref:Glutamine--fructose-6-phosphate aminotransferase [isomerizing] n=1 Tax=Candidatus Nephthysia bennettiae TaxID=3127016 RepID=A0A934K987_9BACT|nr:glutamine--fructose-6-phosphate transaminase (isomerizing) [Candidatus Dormibacteraeota bacterium]MBJ7610914.1 glutamine--fructose-6-phosphate transaminase (isomerizing) [Candidatus Dormibacteraeota bacterium]PZR89591.1 MAG: glutamine--fructose-6-phosphate transaminase (isomerizing) [Candidatus Dormibacteraeota bacterium]